MKKKIYNNNNNNNNNSKGKYETKWKRIVETKKKNIHTYV